MTADAKIGLLLGLVFIFIIAFIINGLPGLWGHPQPASATSVASKTNEKLSPAGSPQKPDWQRVLQQEGVDVAPPKAVGNVTPAADVVPHDVVVAKDGGAPGVLFGDRKSGGGVQPLAETPSTVDLTGLGQPKPEPIPVSPKPEKATPQTPGPKGVNVKPALPASGPALSANKQAVQDYLVRDGDTLATIAKKVYGTVEGNKLANVNRIFERNRTLLKSPDAIAAGQKLSIPPLPATVSNPAKPEDVLPATHFTTVPAVGKPSLADGKISQPQTDGRWYVVQDGDYLWKIAASQLGSGSRFEEIAKLNAAVLKSKDTLTVGTRLRLPAK